MPLTTHPRLRSASPTRAAPLRRAARTRRFGTRRSRAWSTPLRRSDPTARPESTTRPAGCRRYGAEWSRVRTDREAPPARRASTIPGRAARRRAASLGAGPFRSRGAHRARGIRGRAPGRVARGVIPIGGGRGQLGFRPNRALRDPRGSAAFGRDVGSVSVSRQPIGLRGNPPSWRPLPDVAEYGTDVTMVFALRGRSMGAGRRGVRRGRPPNRADPRGGL